METALQNLTATIEKLVGRMDALEKRIAAGAPAGEMSPAEEEFEQMVNEKFMPLLETGKKISEIVGKQMEEFLVAHKMLQKLIGAAARSKKPADVAAEVQKVAKPMFDKLNEIAQYKDKHFRAKEIEHIAGISEAAAAGAAAPAGTPAAMRFSSASMRPTSFSIVAVRVASAVSILCLLVLCVRCGAFRFCFSLALSAGQSVHRKNLVPSLVFSLFSLLLAFL